MMDDNDVMIITSNGTIIRVHVKDISIFGRATRGVTLMRATAENYIADCAATTFDEGEESAVPENDAGAGADAEAGADEEVTDETSGDAEDRTEE